MSGAHGARAKAGSGGGEAGSSGGKAGSDEQRWRRRRVDGLGRLIHEFSFIIIFLFV